MDWVGNLELDSIQHSGIWWRGEWAGMGGTIGRGGAMMAGSLSVVVLRMVERMDKSKMWATGSAVS